MAKFISHLDLLRCFERAIMRSGLPVEYSNGFNPHQKMTFSLPTPVGVTSECETVDISFYDGVVSDEEITNKLNENLPPDIRVQKTGNIIHNASGICCAEYIVKLYSDSEIREEWIRNFFSKDEYIVLKKTKKKIDKPINILEYVRAWEILENSENEMQLRFVLDAGGERNLKPDVLINAIASEYTSIIADRSDIHRHLIFCNDEAEKILIKFE